MSLMRFKSVLAASALAIPLIFAASQANAYLIFSGEDLNSSDTVPVPTLLNAAEAQDNFLSNLDGVGTQDFEGIPFGTAAPVSLSFAGSGKTAVLSGAGGVVSVPAGLSVFGLNGTSGDNFWAVDAGPTGFFEVNLSSETAAFGFYGIDIGDYGGTLQIRLATPGGQATRTVNHTLGIAGSTSGSVLFFGLIAENDSELFTKVSFFSTVVAARDGYGFDDIIIGSKKQVPEPDPVPVPEPGSLAIFAIGLAGLGFFGWRRRTA